ncbi:hypothetical protein EDB87DRAFT_797545 [Lactarius vividus]|nr:hypothetical protein EDB87DRAFT_797545 [Lactarius vividus]
MRARDRPPERLAHVCASSVAFFFFAMTSTDIIHRRRFSKSSVEPPQGRNRFQDDVLSLSKSHQNGGPTTRPTRTVAIDWAAVSASRCACWSPGIPRPSSSSRRNRKIVGLIRWSREVRTRVHTPTPRQKRAPAIMVPFSSRIMHQSTGSSRTPPQGAQ